MTSHRSVCVALITVLLVAGAASRAGAAPVPFVGTLKVDLTSTVGGGAATLPIPGAGAVTINGASGVLTPITAVTIPAFAFFGTVGPPNVGTNFFFGGISGFRTVANYSIVVNAGGACTAGHPNVLCPGGGLAGFGPLAGTIYLSGPHPMYFLGAGSSTGSPSHFASGAGWTTGTVTAAPVLAPFGTPIGPPLATAGSVGPTTLSLVSPIAFNVPVLGGAGLARSNGFARISMTLALACGDGLVSMGETCDDGNTAPDDGCDASCQVEPGFTCSSAPSVCGVGIVGTKLIIVDKLTAASKAKIVYVAKDAAAGKGTTNDPALISATLAYQIPTLAAAGSAGMPGGAGWLVNKEKVAKYVNKDAPLGGSVKVAVIKPGKLLKAVLKDLGDSPIDIFQGGSDTTPVDAKTQFTVVDGATTRRHCGLFTGCVRKLIAGGTGAKVVCKGGAVDPTCGT